METKGALIVTWDPYQQICFNLIKEQTPPPKIGVDWEFFTGLYSISRTKEITPSLRWCDHPLLVITNPALAKLCRTLLFQVDKNSGAPHWFVNGEEYWCIIDSKGAGEVKNEGKNEICCVCMESEINICNVPCGHVATCSKCLVSKCVICRADVEKHVRIYRV